MSFNPTNPQPLVFSIKEATQVSKLGKTRIYELIATGQLQVTRIGRRTLVRADSLRALITPAD
ncbi:helix-turn-helix domain-containing protein [Allopontixanthobacter sediminis]|uniref:Helix-turn-helix domain-containing protein n=1 Tax=Allopontixanthobacter sediminis TaxID=1689985 RepID=A0A845BB85_9SPHN|nr:helix-turn-helix domain-containing protein [Allopontixanthobacter sediminis]MXP44839.1 helix-turn-helix domain-containing protein [Allopontixanthobacter sediminis]